MRRYVGYSEIENQSSWQFTSRTGEINKKHFFHVPFNLPHSF